MSKTDSDGKKRLTLEKTLEIFSQTRNEKGELSMEHMYPYYHPDVRFRDSIQTIHGLDKLKEMGDRLLRRCTKGYEMEVHDVAQNGNVIFLHWTMTTRYMGAPEAPLDGTSILTLNEDGLVIDQRDHYDFWGDTIETIPGLNKLYRWFMKTLLG